ncbi:MAG TPA: FAD-dependent oxidoreductase [Candidatus Acidoferrales bacterium]|nr:FAD-dependent oxidoreductase [Candidatus Acidoferrales bacterium]
MQSPDVIIIGGGIVGSSIAYHLTESGCTNVLILERESHQGKGSTGKSMGGVRAQFSTSESIRMSLYSIPFFSSFEEVIGHPSGYRAQGYLFVATNQRHLDYLCQNYTRQVAAGLKTVQLLKPADVAHFAPEIRCDDVLGGAFCSTDGFVDPHSVMTGFAQRAMERGVQILRDAEVTAILTDSRGVAGVVTTAGTFSSRTVVNAAGAWAGQVARMAGVDLPVEPLRRMLVPTEPFDKVAQSSPMVVDMATGFHYRPEGRGILMAWNDPEETAGFKLNFDPAFIEKILTRGVTRLPVLEEAEVNPKRAWAGLYEMTPDHHPVLGAVKPLPGFFLANGFSGHGVMHSPATGRITADLILKGRTDLIDSTLLSIDRFAVGNLLHETAIL